MALGCVVNNVHPQVTIWFPTPSHATYKQVPYCSCAHNCGNILLIGNTVVRDSANKLYRPTGIVWEKNTTLVVGCIGYEIHNHAGWYFKSKKGRCLILLGSCWYVMYYDSTSNSVGLQAYFEKRHNTDGGVYRIWNSHHARWYFKTKGRCLILLGSQCCLI